MDRTGIIVISICVLLLGWWFVEQNKMQQAQAHWQQTNQVAQLTAQLAATNTVTAKNPAPAANASTATTPVVFTASSPEQTLTLVNGRARYTFTSRGGGLKSVELLDYTNMISVHWKGRVPNYPATLNQHAPVPVLAVLGDQSLVGDGEFALTPLADGVRAEKVLADGLVISKEFHLSSNYLVKASVNLKNNSDKPARPRRWMRMTAASFGARCGATEPMPRTIRYRLLPAAALAVHAARPNRKSVRAPAT